MLCKISSYSCIKYHFSLTLINSSYWLLDNISFYFLSVFACWLVILLIIFYQLAFYVALKNDYWSHLSIVSWVICFLAIEFYGFFIPLTYQPFYQIYGLQLSEDSFFILLTISLAAHKLLNLMPFYLFSVLLPELWGLCWTNASSIHIVRSFIILGTNKPLIHFNYVCICCKMKVNLHSSFIYVNSFPNIPDWRGYLFIKLFLASLPKAKWP